MSLVSPAPRRASLWGDAVQARSAGVPSASSVAVAPHGWGYMGHTRIDKASVTSMAMFDDGCLVFGGMCGLGKNELRFVDVGDGLIPQRPRVVPFYGEIDYTDDMEPEDEDMVIVPPVVEERVEKLYSVANRSVRMGVEHGDYLGGLCPLPVLAHRRTGVLDSAWQTRRTLLVAASSRVVMVRQHAGRGVVKDMAEYCGWHGRTQMHDMGWTGVRVMSDLARVVCCARLGGCLGVADLDRPGDDGWTLMGGDATGYPHTLRACPGSGHRFLTLGAGPGSQPPHRLDCLVLWDLRARNGDPAISTLRDLRDGGAERPCDAGWLSEHVLLLRTTEALMEMDLRAMRPGSWASRHMIPMLGRQSGLVWTESLLTPWAGSLGGGGGTSGGPRECMTFMGDGGRVVRVRLSDGADGVTVAGARPEFDVTADAQRAGAGPKPETMSLFGWSDGRSVAAANLSQGCAEVWRV